MGNPNPSPATRFKPGQSGNPSGRSKKEQEAHNKSAAIAAEMKLKALSCLQDKVSDPATTADQAIEMLFNADVQRMFKEVEDRAHGTPKSTTEMGGVNGTGIPMMLTVATKIVDAD